MKDNANLDFSKDILIAHLILNIYYFKKIINNFSGQKKKFLDFLLFSFLNNIYLILFVYLIDY